MIKLDLNPPVHQLRQFGYIALVGFPAVGAVLTYVMGVLPPLGLYILIGAGVLCGIAAAAKLDAVIKPFYWVMMLIGYPIGMVLSHVLMAVIYYGMFTPVGLAFRLFGRDLLERKPDPSASSYWTIRETQRTPASYLRLY